MIECDALENNLPSAALTLLANDLYDDSLFYMHADPVHLRAELDHAVLTSYVDLEIKDSETNEIYEVLNKHFNDDGLSFFCVNNGQWFVSSKDEIALETTPLLEAIGRNINFLLPKGRDQSVWKRFLCAGGIATVAKVKYRRSFCHVIKECSFCIGQTGFAVLWR